MTKRVLCRRQSSCASAQNSLGGQVDALALDGLDHEGGHVAAAQLAGQGVDVAEGHHVAAGQQGPEPVAELLAPVE